MENIEFTKISSSSIIASLSKLHSKLAIVADQNVLIHYPIDWPKNCLLIPFSASEKTKSRKQKEKIEDLLLEFGLKKQDGLVALGGGVTLDLTGFIASTYLRGIAYYSIPTTLLAMVDAAIGGKNGINTPKGKNLIGSYLEPIKIFINLAYLDTLPNAHHLNGLSEILKYGVIADASLFSILKKKEPISESLIKRCIEIKTEIVKTDYFDQGVRKILNFGHTIGHALETASGYRLHHGLAVYYGMLLESPFSDLFRNFIPLLQSIGALYHYPSLSFKNLNLDLLKNALLYDKKNDSSFVSIVVSSPYLEKNSPIIKNIPLDLLFDHILSTPSSF